jgi:hypothetical protein
MPILVLDNTANMPIPALAPFNASTGNGPCQYWYWTKVQKCQYWYGHNLIPVLVMECAHTGTDSKYIFAIFGMGTTECQYR